MPDDASGFEATYSLRDARHVDKALYLAADTLFYKFWYDSYIPNDHLKHIVEQVFQAVGYKCEIHRSGVWSHVVGPRGSQPAKLPEQGWKIHISATTQNYKEILQLTSEVLVRRGIQYKFANDVDTLRLMTSKRWNRGGSGKFITIYPPSINEFKQTIEELSDRLSSFPGPYILSDKRYKDCRCLYYRYGGFISNVRIDEIGRKYQVIFDADGNEVRDARLPYYLKPSWIDEPFETLSDVDGEALTLNNGRYHIEASLGFSNTGGVYLGTDNITGSRVVIKEARPYTEMTTPNQDAVSNIKNESDILNRLDGLRTTPKLIDVFSDWENTYLVEEYIDGLSIRQIMLKHSPLLKVNPSSQDRLGFRKIFKSVFEKLMNGVSAIHDRGIILGDISPANVLVNESSLDVTIIDLETAFHVSNGCRQNLFTRGFRRSSETEGASASIESDMFAIAMLMVYCICPITGLSEARGDFLSNVVSKMIEDLGTDWSLVYEVIDGLSSGRMSLSDAASKVGGTWPRQSKDATCKSRKNIHCLNDTCDQIAQFIIKSGEVNNSQLIFPVDPFGQETNSISFGFGSTGIVSTLSRCGYSLPSHLRSKFVEDLDTIDMTGIPLGILNGAAGISLALIAGKLYRPAIRFISYANNQPLDKLSHSLFCGAAGLGLANLACGMFLKENSFVQKALEIGEWLAISRKSDKSGIYWERDNVVRIGYGYGQAGVAMFLLRLSQLTSDKYWLDLGKSALEFDLSQQREVEPNVFSVTGSMDDSSTYEQYEQGSAGLAKVAIRYGMLDSIQGIMNDLRRKYSSFAGMIYGLSGILDVWTDAYLYSGDERYIHSAQLPLSGIKDLYLINNANGIAVPGDGLFRVSCDFATGTVGVLAALHRYNNLYTDDFTLDILDGVNTRLGITQNRDWNI